VRPTFDAATTIQKASLCTAFDKALTQITARHFYLNNMSWPGRDARAAVPAWHHAVRGAG